MLAITLGDEDGITIEIGEGKELGISDESYDGSKDVMIEVGLL